MTGDNGLWPPLETGYAEEFGAIDPDVHQVAGKLWSQAQQMAIDLLHDTVTGYRLLKRATAAVSQLPPNQRAQIRNLPGYLFQTYKRLVLAELEKANGHRAREVEAAQLVNASDEASGRIDRNILIAQLVGLMDPWTRDVFELLVLGYTFDEIGRSRNRNPHVVRNRYRLALRRLAARVEAGPRLDRTRQPAGNPPGSQSGAGHVDRNDAQDAASPLKKAEIARVLLDTP